MPLSANLPSARQPIIEAGGTTSRPFYVFFQSVATTIDELSAKIGDVTTTPPTSITANVTGGPVGAHKLQQINVFVELLRLDLDFVPIDIPLRQNRSGQKSQHDQKNGSFTHEFLLENLKSRKYTLNRPHTKGKLQEPRGTARP